MRNGLITLAILGTIGIGTTASAAVQTCPPGQILQAGICRPAPTAAPAPRTAMHPPAATARAPAPAHAMAAPAATPGVGTAAHPMGVTTTTTTVHTGTSAAPGPAPTAGTMTAEKREVCPAGFTLYRGGCAPTQDYNTALFK